MFSFQLPNPPKEQPELIVVKEELSEVDNRDRGQDRTSDSSELKYMCKVFSYHKMDLEHQ